MKKFKIQCRYHTEEVTEFEMFARSLKDAKEIAKIQFESTFTNKCKLDELIDATQKRKP